ncbi:MAG: hypothetical protein KF878_22360 [Planctomycetes bacterium]|nr:hypothetical protein [Planctomycetota bacterium]
MVDDELRSLQRDVDAIGTPAARLRLATALERSGQHSSADVLRVLLPARDDVEVRARIGRLSPTWISAEFSSHAAHFVDVEPLRTRPRVRWIQRRDPATALFPRHMLLASPLGIVCTGTSTETLQVLDPDSGALRWESAWPTLYHPRPGDPGGYTRRQPELARSTLAMWEPPDFVCRDLWTGCELHRTTLGAQFVQVRVAGGRLLAWGEDELVSLRYPDPRQPPEPEPAWRLRSPFATGFALGPGSVLQLGEELVIGAYARSPRSVVVDASSGVTRAEVSVAFHMADEHGLVGRAHDAHALFRRPADPPLRTCGGVLGLSPDLVLVALQEAGRERVIVETRERGERLGVLVDFVHDYGAVAIARDVIYEFTWRVSESFFRREPLPGSIPPSTLRATTGRVRSLWELPHDVLGSAVMGIAPLHERRVYGLTQDGAVFCLEEDAPDRATRNV